MIFGNFGDMLKQAKEMQSNLKKVREELAQRTYEAEEAGVKIVVNGEMEVKEVSIGSQTDRNQLPQIVKNVANRVLNMAKTDAAEKLKSITGGLSIPGLT